MKRRLRVLGCLAVACLTLPSCTADHGSSATGGTSTAPATSTAPPGSATPGGTPAQESVLHLTVAGVDRSVLVDRPTNGTGKRPLIVFLHGARGSAADVRGRLGLGRDASAAGVVMAYPESDTPSHSWRVGCCNAVAKGTEDLDFVAAVIDTLVTQGVADPAHVVIGGFSAGALMANTFACEHPELIRGVVSLAGALLEPPGFVSAEAGARHCTPRLPVTVLEIHGTADTTVPAQGSTRTCSATLCGPGVNGFLAPAKDINGWWRRLDDCAQPTTRSTPFAETSLAACARGTSVGLALVTGAGHSLAQLARTFAVRANLLDLALDRPLTAW